MCFSENLAEFLLRVVNTGQLSNKKILTDIRSKVDREINLQFNINLKNNKSTGESTTKKKRRKKKNHKIVIHGIHQQHSNWNNKHPKDEVQTFFREKLELTGIKIKNAHLMGRAKNNIPIVVKLNAEHKNLVFKNASKLKNFYPTERYSIQNYWSKEEQQKLKPIIRNLKQTGRKIRYKELKMYVKDKSVEEIEDLVKNEEDDLKVENLEDNLQVYNLEVSQSPSENSDTLSISSIPSRRIKRRAPLPPQFSHTVPPVNPTSIQEPAKSSPLDIPNPPACISTSTRSLPIIPEKPTGLRRILSFRKKKSTTSN